MVAWAGIETQRERERERERENGEEGGESKREGEREGVEREGGNRERERDCMS